MNTMHKITEKRIYNNPEITFIKLDNDISLILDSMPPAGPDEGASLTPEYLKTNPFKTNLA